jgi:hypothetical protein
MIRHIVLFRPRAGLSADERFGLAAALRSAIKTIPSIRRARVGRRIRHGRPYEQQMRVDYEYAAKMYLEHPAHEALATRFFTVLDESLIYDFEFEEGDGLAGLT